MIFVVDTHTLIWYLQDSRLLGREASRLLADGDVSIIVPAIVLAEAKHLATRRRVALDFGEILASVEADQRISVGPVDLDVVAAMPQGLEIHDALICGTALVYRDILGEDVAIITKDERVRSAGLVPTVW